MRFRCVKRRMVLCCAWITIVFFVFALAGAGLAQEETGEPLVLPSVDISPWLNGRVLNGEEEEALVALVREHAVTYGTMFVTGVPESLVNARAPLEDVFAIVPQVEKQKLQVQANGFTRGFVLPGSESGSSKYREVKEAFSLGKEWPNDHVEWANVLEGPNVWPPSLADETKKRLIRLYEDSSAVAMAIVRVVEKVLAMPEQSLVETCLEGDRISLLRLFHYFATPNEVQFSHCGRDQECTGSSPHTDWGFLTIVGFKRKDVGLQILHDNQWRSVVEADDKSGWSVLVNFGDYLSVATEGRLVSPLHRVVPQSIERYSFVYFFYPNFNTSLHVGQGVKKAAQKLSLLQEQSDGSREASTDGGLEEEEEERIDSFGQYITMKWAQVFRDKLDKEEL